MKRYLGVFWVLIVLVFAPLAYANNQSFSLQAMVAMQKMNLDIDSLYKDETESLIYGVSGEIRIRNNLAIIGDFEVGNTQKAELIMGMPLSDLSGNYQRQSAGLLYLFSPNRIELGAGIGFDMGQEKFSWSGDNDNTGNRDWHWERKDNGISGLVSISYKTPKIQLKNIISYAPTLNSAERTKATRDSEWETWKQDNIKASLLKVRSSLEYNFTNNLGVVLGAKYFLYKSPEAEVTTDYESSDDNWTSVKDTANAATEQGGLVFLGIKFAL
ncbi:MAG TPA: outer membrane beta-barrel protein [Firmicutes bacterium]|nr:outer membrane beta-barrel protein [Bacillota bacterium]